jgi:hypothetical protein
MVLDNLNDDIEEMGEDGTDCDHLFFIILLLLLSIGSSHSQFKGWLAAHVFRRRTKSFSHHPVHQ